MDNKYLLLGTFQNTTQMDIWKSKQLTLDMVDLEWVSESSLVFQAVPISFWLPMCFTIYRSQSPLAGIPGAISGNPSLLVSATLFPHSMLSILLSVRGYKMQTHFYKAISNYECFVLNNCVLKRDSNEKYIENIQIYKNILKCIKNRIKLPLCSNLWPVLLYNKTGETIFSIFICFGINKFWSKRCIPRPHEDEEMGIIWKASCFLFLAKICCHMNHLFIKPSSHLWIKIHHYATSVKEVLVTKVDRTD